MWGDANLIKILRAGGVAVIPTDTLYGLVGRALNPSVVNRIYELKCRMPEKPCIILIGGLEDLEKFSVVLSEEQKKVLRKYWFFDSAQDKTRPTSIILDCPEESFSYLHRGTKTLAFRVPQSEPLRNLLTQVGPLIAPSANPEGESPARKISEARKYFGGAVDFYASGKTLSGKPSRLIKLRQDGSVDVLRG